MSASTSLSRKRRWPWVAGILIVAAIAAAWWWLAAKRGPDAQAARRAPGAIPVVTARAQSRDVPVRLKANGSVAAVQSVELRAQITSTVREVHIREGQNVGKGDLLFSLEARTEEANLAKALAQVEKDRADLATAQRTLERQRELFGQKFISQSALDAAQNSVDTLTGQLAIDTAAVEGVRAARAYTEIRAPFAGRTGAISVRSGSLVQPNSSVLVSIAQIDPVTVSFTLPEKELPALQRAAAGGPVAVTATTQEGAGTFKGRLVFVDNAVDTATGTIRVKAEFANGDARLWPGMYVNVDIAPRTIANAIVVPAQAVQTGPDSRFIYEVGDDGKVVPRTVTLGYIEEGFAVVDGVAAGARVVVEGAQNLRPGSLVAEADSSSPGGPEPVAEKKKGKKPS